MITFAQCDVVIITASLAGDDRLNSMKIDADASLWRTNVPVSSDISQVASSELYGASPDRSSCGSLRRVASRLMIRTMMGLLVRTPSADEQVCRSPSPL
jgi:hypothetical protein